jgi:hypothetical protein
MADKKISALTASSTPLAGTEVLPIVQSGSTVKVSVANLTAGRAVGASSVTTTGNIVGAGDLIIGAAVRQDFYQFTLAHATATRNGMGSVTDTTGFKTHIGFINPNGDVGYISTNGTATAYNTSSDYRLKNIDGPLLTSGNYIDALKPVQGSWKADGSRFIGFLAHEIQDASETPIAAGEKDGERMQAMSYSAPELIANMVAELKSLRARVADLETK